MFSEHLMPPRGVEPWLELLMQISWLHIECANFFPTQSSSCENKWIDSPRITIVNNNNPPPQSDSPRITIVSISRWKCALNHDYENYNERYCQCSKFSFIDFVLMDRKSLSGKQSKSAMASGKSSRCRFSFSAARIRNFRFFFSFNSFLPLLRKFERHCLWAIRIFQWFSYRNRKKFRRTTLYYESWRLLYRSFINLTEWRQRGVTCQQLIDDIKHTWKISYFFTCVVTAFLRAGNPCMTP